MTPDRRRLLRVAQRVWLAALAGVLVWVLAARWDDVTGLVAGARPAWLVAALSLGVAQLAVSAAFWRAAIRALGGQIGWPAVVGATARSVPARYLPGSIWYPLGRAAALAGAGVPKRTLGVVAGLESALSVVVALCLGGTLVLATGLAPSGAWALAAAVAALVVVASPPVVNRVLAVVAARRGGSAPTLTWRRHAGLLAWMAVFWVWSATTFTVYLHAFPGVEARGVLAIAGSFLVAWGVGFLAPFAPQGMGVFEVTVTALLAGQVSAGIAVVVAGYRALMAVRDGLAFVAGALGRAGAHRARAGSPPRD